MLNQLRFSAIGSLRGRHLFNLVKTNKMRKTDIQMLQIEFFKGGNLLGKAAIGLHQGIQIG